MASRTDDTLAPARAPLGAPDGPPANLGPHIRELRRERRWSLNELSARSGIAASTLSKVENGVLSLTYDRLLMLAHGFGLTLSEFLVPTPVAQPTPIGAARISWAGTQGGDLVETAAYRYHYLCTDLRAKRMVPIRSQVMARSLEEFGPLLRHDSEEYVFVLQGRIEVVTEFYAPRVLDVGESVYLDSRQGHAYLNVGQGEAWILSVNAEAPE